VEVRKTTDSENPVKSLLIDRKEMMMGIAEEFQGFLRIDSTDYTPILPTRLSDLSTRNRILLELGVAYMCFVGNLAEKPSLARDQLLDRCSVADSTLRGRLSELRKEGFIVTHDEGDELTAEGMMEFKKLLAGFKEESEDRK